jgi:hypothetical protein
MSELPEEPGTATLTPTVSVGPDSVEATDGQVGMEIVNTAAAADEEAIVAQLVEASEHLWTAGLTRNGETKVLAPTNLGDVELAITPRVTRDREVATFVDVVVKIGRTMHRQSYRVLPDKLDALTEFLNDRMDRAVDVGKWDPESVLNLLNEIGELRDTTIMGKVQPPKSR